MANAKIEKAIVKFVGATETVGASNFRKRALIVTIDNDTDYPQTIKIEAAQAKCDDQNLNELRPGDEVTVHFNFRGNEWNNPKTNLTEVFNTLQFWKVEINRTSAGNKSGANYGAPAPAYSPPANLSSAPDDEDDLPFNLGFSVIPSKAKQIKYFSYENMRTMQCA